MGIIGLGFIFTGLMVTSMSCAKITKLVEMLMRILGRQETMY